MYEYLARVVRVVDGDTIWLDVDLGCDTHVNLSVRLAGLNAPEMSSPEGQAAKDYVVAWLSANQDIHTGQVLLETVKDHREKYGRYLGFVMTLDKGVSLNDDLIRDGQAVPYDGGKRAAH